jgi:hypothetical protein
MRALALSREPTADGTETFERERERERERGRERSLTRRENFENKLEREGGALNLVPKTNRLC